MRLEPAVAPLTSPVRLGRYRYFATFYACRVGLPATLWTGLEQRMGELAGRFSRPGEVIWGTSMLPTHGLVVRGLSTTHRRIAAALPLFWGLAKRLIYGVEAVPPRKVP
jgi:urease accessory protein